MRCKVLFFYVLFPGVVFIFADTLENGPVKKDTSSVPVRSLDKMVVYGSCSPSEKVLEAKDFIGKYQDLPAVLEQESGIMIQRCGAVGEYATASIRGEPAAKVKVLLDGMPLNSASDGAVDLSKIPLDVIQRVEIYKGVAPFELSQTGIGCIINLSTSRAGHNFLSANAEGGSFGYLKTGGMIDIPARRLFQTLSADWVSSKNNYPYRDTRFEYGDNSLKRKLNNDYNSLCMVYNGLFQADSANLFKTEFNYENYDKGINVVFFPDDWQSIRNKGQGAGIIERFETRPAPAASLAVEARGRIVQDIYTAPASLSYFLDEKTEDRTASGDVRGICRLHLSNAFSVNLSAVGAYERYIPLTRGLTPFSARRSSAAGSAEAVYYGDDFFYARLMLVESYARDNVFGTYSYLGFSESVKPNEHYLPGIQFQLRTGKVNSLNAFLEGLIDSHNPTFFEKFGKGGTYHGNPGLIPETRFQIEPGVSHETGTIKNTLSVFAGMTRDKIISTAQSQNMFVPRNYTNVWNAGIEWNARIELFKLLVVSNNSTYMKNVFYNMSSPSMEGKSVPLVPDFKDNLGLSLNFRNFQVGHDAQFCSRYFYDPDNIDTCAVKPVLNAFLSYSGLACAKISYRVENYLNVQNEDFKDYPRPGITHVVSLQMNISGLFFQKKGLL